MTSIGPKISIITIVYNRVNDIEYTLKSITEQTYKNIEFIVVDGNSKDGTLTIIEKYLDKINHFISEKDSGIYDAMNKGLRIATGDYVLFINGGDNLHHKETIEKVFHSLENTHQNLPELIFGECMLIDRNRKNIQTRSAYKNQILPKKLEIDSFKYGTNVSHQSFIINRVVAPFFDLKYQWSSDVDWMIKCIKYSKDNYCSNEIISDFVIGDHSEKYKLASLKERFNIMKNHYGIRKTIYYHLCIIIKKLKG